MKLTHKCAGDRVCAAQGLKSLCENLKLAHFCSARLQAGTLESNRCPPGGGRYMNQNRILTHTLKPGPPTQISIRRAQRRIGSLTLHRVNSRAGTMNRGELRDSKSHA